MTHSIIKFDMKRQLAYCDEEMTKLRRSKQMACIEDLSNELFYEIFDYLDGCDLYKVFSNLNERFQTMLACLSVRLKISLRQFNLLDHHRNIILPNRHKIISLCLLDKSAINVFFRAGTVMSSFHRLESIVLYDLKSKHLETVLFDLALLLRLYRLTLAIGDYNVEDFNDVYRLIFSLPVLKYHKLCFRAFVALISPKITINNQQSTIEYLNIGHQCSLNDLVSIFSNTPHLRRIVCNRLIPSYQSIDQTTIVLPCLTHLSIRNCCLQFNEFEVFLRKISSHLKMLHISTHRNEDYLDADRWERFICQYIPHLHNFYFEYEELIDDNFQVTQNKALINRFTSSFWLERQWHLKIDININYFFLTKVTYSIHPYRKKWYDSGNEGHCNFNRLPGAELVVSEPSFTDYNEALIDNMDLFFDIVRITKLDFVFEATFVGMLLDLLRYLPNLDSLRVWSLSLIKPRCLHAEEERIFRLIAADNEIKKVNIQRMIDMTQIQFLIDLCPLMQYFEIGCLHDNDLNVIIQFILKQNRKYISHLRILCLCVQIADDKMVGKLRDMIKCTKLRHEYSITRIVNKIYIERK